VTSPGFRTVAAAVLLPLLLAAAPVCAAEIVGAEPGGLYRATVIVTGREETRQAGLRAAFLAVLAKASGDPRLLHDPAAAALAEQAPEAVAVFGYRDRMAGIPVHDEQGSRDRPYDLTGDFDPASIDAALAALGRSPWPQPRPAVLAIVIVRTAIGEFVLSSGGRSGHDMLEALAAAAEGMALPTVIPDAAVLKRLGSLSPAALFTPGPEFAEASLRTGAVATLIGTMVWNATDRGWIAEWHLETGEEPGALPPARWAVRGVSFDAAFRSGIGGAAQVLSGNGAPE
jgi:hypothetical protein